MTTSKMPSTRRNIKKWGFAFLLASPVFYLYGLHFLNYDSLHSPTGFIQWEHILYMCSSKEYATGNATFLYEWPVMNNYNNGKVFFQPQIFILGYLWKWINCQPGYIMAVFGLVFAVLTLRIVINIIDLVLPADKHKKLITILFCWGGGILSASGILLHFTFFNGSAANLSNHIFFLDPAGGSWCLNFGRSLIYPLEAYYHFLFAICILLVLKRNFPAVFLVMVLLIFSHPYTAIEIISIILVWLVAEVYYFKNKLLKGADVWYIFSALILFFIYYGIILNRIEIYRQINKINTLDWGYKAWHFIPAYAIVWLLSFFAIKNVPALKLHFATASNRLFFWWGTVAFLLSVHGFAIKPVQPIHFTRGYVYAGFFLFGMPVLQTMVEKLLLQRARGYIVISALVFVFLFDNITWFCFAAERKNGAGVYFTTSETEVIDYFKNKNEKGIVIGSEKNYELNAGIQLYTKYKGWIPHPYLTLDADTKRMAVDSLLVKSKIDESWKTRPVYLYCAKNDSTLQIRDSTPVFENSSYKIFKIN